MYVCMYVCTHGFVNLCREFHVGPFEFCYGGCSKFVLQTICSRFTRLPGVGRWAELLNTLGLLALLSMECILPSHGSGLLQVVD